MKGPKIKLDTFGADLANALMLRPVYRKPAKRTHPNCDSDIHEVPVPAVVTGWFRNYYQPNPESVLANYCARCVTGMPKGMFTASKELT